MGWRDEDSTLVVSLDLEGNYCEVTDDSDVDDHVRLDAYYVAESDPDSDGFRSTQCVLDVDARGFYVNLDAKLTEVFGYSA